MHVLNYDNNDLVYFIKKFPDRISPVFGCRCLFCTLRARRTGRTSSGTPSDFSGALVHSRPIAPIAFGDPRGSCTSSPSGCRPSGCRTSGSSPPGSSPPGIARPHCRALLMFDFCPRNLSSCTLTGVVHKFSSSILSSHTIVKLFQITNRKMLFR